MSMNLSELFFDGMTKADVDNAFAKMKELNVDFERIAGSIRPMAFLAADIERHDLSGFIGIEQLKEHIRQSWTCREIEVFRSYLHAGRFVPDSGRWVSNTAGISVMTSREDYNLENAWRHLLFVASALMGAAAVLRLNNSRIVGWVALSDECDAPTPWDMTINELAQEIDKARKREIGVEAIEKLDELRRDIADVKAAVSVKIPSAKDYVVSTEQMSSILGKLGVKAGKRIIQKWEQYLKGDIEHGTKPPLDYTLYTRMSIESASAWAQTHASRQYSKLRTKVSYEALNGGRN